MSADSPRGRLWREIRTLLGSDLRLHLRDRLTLVLLFGMPLAVYPLMMWGLGRAQAAQDQATDQEVLPISAPADLDLALTPEDHLRVVAEPFAVNDLATGPLASFVPAHDGQGAVVQYAGGSERSKRARNRLEAVLERRQLADQRVAFAEAGLSVAPDDVVAVTYQDLAGAAEQTGETLGRWLPMLLVFLVVGGGAHTALDLVTGERERGTLETLLTSRVDRRAILVAKYSAVLLFSALSAALSLGSAGVIFALKLSPSLIAAGPLPGAGAWAAAVALLLPLLVLLAAVLVASAAYAPNFRTGQALAMPLLLVLSVPAGLASLREVPFTPLLALVPIANVSLAIRSVLSGQDAPGLVLFSALAAVGWAVVGLVVASRLLGREAVIIGPVQAAARRQRGQYAPEALGLYVLSFLLLWFFGQMAEAQNLLAGLVGSQVLLIALPGVAVVAWLGLPVGPTLSWRRPAPADLGLALVAGICAPALSTGVFQLQTPWIPSPTAFLTGMSDSILGDRPEWVTLLAFAVLPALCEETLFRGAMAGLLRRAMHPAASIALTAVLFGFLHLSAPRLLPTASLGVLLGVAGLRSGALPVTMLIHALHNGLVLAGAERGWSVQQIPPAGQAAVAVVSVLCVAGMGRTGRAWRAGS